MQPLLQPDSINGATTATGQGFNPSALNQQNTALLGNQQGTPGTGAGFSPDMLNSSQVNPQLAAMIKALKGGI